jgi:hypothetical protein
MGDLGSVSKSVPLTNVQGFVMDFVIVSIPLDFECAENRRRFYIRAGRHFFVEK